ncbi:cysteine hydrolase [Bacillus sp. M6-12]|uniref:cysteine hydrolase family protein n=1 Tax=Bacillus sp. M6-12 TaxID=2054166 RepID=UPI000C77D2B5|nr:cysteine hydrolase family protein [Bacillus sp. M6-12]PLS15858.1 cysteine hydrolase [Bacillus sp. M6-12]
MQEQRSALLIMDVQFGPLWGAYKKEEILSVIQAMIKKAEDEEIPIIYTQHEELPGGFLIRGSQFWQLDPVISPRPQDIIIHKQAADAFYQTSLEEELKVLGINHLVVTGARTEFCVDTTCRAALSLGFAVTLVEDGHTTVDGTIPAETIIKHHNHTLSTVNTPHNKVSVMPADKIKFGAYV